MSIFDDPNYEVMRDMTCQPATCEQCGGLYRRDGAYLICQANNDHERFCEPVGREDHPRHAEWQSYLETNGREAFERAIERHLERQRFF
jgi:hypothetical protein